ncbi:MAG TPA: L-seryl-tRNA(Sec) selenium transferase [Acidobacteriota bacterium]|jgi:L-seryl-tRNA(Ser) seleniumtransferase|nr:L-seryl-tRNA(Sec) selenium transferase [Acidobacteriota bacterium]
MDSVSLYRKLPSVDALLQQPDLQGLLSHYPRARVVSEIQRHLSELRCHIQSGMEPSELDATIAQLVDTITAAVRKGAVPSLQRVINATGVIIHTNLGRAPLASGSIDYLHSIATGYCNLEYDLETGQRSHRERHVEPLLEELTGHPVAAAVVNNNAAAVMLILDTFASDGEVIVSRGELVEIGGSFRIPDILEKSGARLREVGTTNKTRVEDYARAINEKTRLILRVHPSNFHMVGFTERPSVSELAELAHRRHLPLVEDLGSGLIQAGSDVLGNEPTARQSLDAGVDLISFSGDKLLGATQAGIILGMPEFIQRIRSNPLMRALRADKTKYAVLVYSLRRYLSGEAEELPTRRFLTLPATAIQARCQKLMTLLQSCDAEVRESFSLVGGGSAPDAKIPTFVVAVKPPRGSPDAMHHFLRQQDPPILARIEDDRIVVDLRTVSQEEDALIGDALSRYGAANDWSSSSAPNR